MNSPSLRWRIVTALGVSLTTLALCPWWGTMDITLSEALRGTLSDAAHRALYDLRLPRVLLAFLVGGCLSQSGLVLQALLRNPLVSEFTLGVASGAALGSALFFQLGMTWSMFALSGSVWLAFCGALGTTGLVYGLSKVLRRRDAVTLLLAGVAVSFFLSSAILLVQYAADFTALARIMRWVMGGIGVAGYREVLTLAPFAFAGVALFWGLSPEMNLIASGDDLAHARGVNVRAVRRNLFLAVSIVVGVAVSLCGPIGFVGLMVPHITRMVFGADHRVLAPMVFLVGGAFLTICDTVARTALSPAEVPVGIITAMIGAPFFVWLLLRRKTVAGF